MAIYGGVAALLAVAVFARVNMLGSMPTEALEADRDYVAAAASVIERGWIGFRSNLTAGQPTGIAYILAGWTAFFGDSVISVRLFASALGLATLGFLYVLVRRMFGERPAVLAVLLLAFAAWHLRYSRLALPVDLLLLAETLTVYLLWRALSQAEDAAGQGRRLAVAGLAFGASVYTHNAYFIFAAAVLLFWGRELLVSQGATGPVVRRAAVFLAPALIVALPHLVALAADAGDTRDRLRDGAVTGTPEYQALNGVTEQTRHILANIAGVAPVVLMAWEAEPERDVSDTRLVGRITAFLVIVGLAVGIARWRRRGHAYIWMLLAATVVGAGLTGEAGMHARLVVAVPAVFAAAGFGLHWLLTWLRGRLHEAVSYGLVALLLALVAFNNVSGFFDEPAVPSASAASGAE